MMDMAISSTKSASKAVHRGYVDGPWGQIHYREAGVPDRDRPSLICFHMSPMTGRTYAHFMAVLAQHGGRHVIAFDTPGFGMSDPPPSPPTIADYAEAFIAALDALGLIDPVDVMGYHTGSMISCELGASHAERIRRLVLVSAPMFTDEDLAQMRAEYRPNLPKEDGSHLLYRWQRFSHHYGLGGMNLEQINDAFPDGLLGRNIEHWGHRAAFEFQPGMRLADVEQPILLLNPQDDLRDYTLRAPEHIRNGRMVMLDGWGHGFLDLHAGAAAELVESFLAAPQDRPFAALAIP